MTIIDRIYEAAIDDASHTALPGYIAAEVQARSCLLLGFDHELRPTSLQRSYFTQEMCDFHMRGDITALDVWTPYGARLGGKVGFTEDRWEASAFARTPFYNEFFRVFGDDTARCAGLVTRLTDGHMSLAVHRGIADRPFDAHARSVISEIVPHLQRMFALRHRLDDAMARTNLLQQTLDGIAHGLMITEASGRIIMANRRAEDLLRAGDGLRMRSGRLVATEEMAQERLTAAIRSAAEWTGARGGALRLGRPGQNAPLRVLVAPMASASPAAILVIEDPEDSDPDLATTLRRMFDLTVAEAELAGLLMEGLTPEQAAETRGVRLNTVRTQIKSLLSKTEALRLSEMVRILARTPRRR